MNIEDEWITKIENNNEPIIIESEEMEDDDWVEDIEEEDKEDVKEGNLIKRKIEKRIS